MIQKIAEYIAAHPQQLAGQIAAHIGISLIALLAAALIGIPCGCLASGIRKGESIIAAPFEMLRVGAVARPFCAADPDHWTWQDFGDHCADPL